MKESNPTVTGTPADSMKMLQAMVGIGVVCALMIVLTYEGTLPRVQRLKAEALEKAIFKVVPGMVTKKDFKIDGGGNIVEAIGDEKEQQMIYAGYDESGKLTGAVVEANGMGFADILKILYGYDFEKQTIVGFYVLESKETPGLGDKIEKDETFLKNFEALDVSLSDDLTAVKNIVVPVKNGAKENPWEVDCITGATITSRAIGNIIGESTKELVPLLYKSKSSFEVQNDDKEKVQK